MSYFYLQVDRLDGETAGAFYYPLGIHDGEKLAERVGRHLDVYRQRGFRIIHFSNRPGYKQATHPCGIKLELIVLRREKPMQMNYSVGLEDDDANTVLH